MREKTGYSCDCTGTGYYGKNCETAYWSTWLSQLLRPSPETQHYLLNHFSWFWYIVNNVEFINDYLLRAVYQRRVAPVIMPPLYTSGHAYTTMEAYYNRSYYAMSLPPVPEDCPTPFGVAGKKIPPSPEVVAEKILKRQKFIPDGVNTSVLFGAFAQHFTHQFFRTSYNVGPGFTHGRHGVDVSNTYGLSVERENMLRTFKYGKLKSQTINGEEWPPYLKDVNVSMQYEPGTPEDRQFALGHPFFGLFPGLFFFNAIWLREHNRVCDVLKDQHPMWSDEQIFQTAKLIITGETIKIVIEDYVQHLASYKLYLRYKPELMFGDTFQYDNRIHLEFNHLYHWHPFNPDEFDIQGTKYTMDDFLFNAEPVVKHGMKDFVDSLSKGLAGRMAHHNHEKNTLEVAVSVIGHERALRMQSFNNYRRRFNLRPYESFEDMTGDKSLAAELEELYGDVEAMDFYVGFFVEKRLENSPFGQTLIEIGAPYSLRGLLSHPLSSPQYWKPSTFGGNVGFDIVKGASLEKLFCKNIKGDCPLVSFRVPADIAREARKAMSAKHDEL